MGCGVIASAKVKWQRKKTKNTPTLCILASIVRMIRLRLARKEKRSQCKKG